MGRWYHSVPGRPVSLDNGRARAYSACSMCGWGQFGYFFLSSIIFLFLLPLSGVDDLIVRPFQ